MRLLFVVMFIFYGVIISVISYSFSNYYQTQNTKSKMIQTQLQSFKIKSDELRKSINNFENELTSLKESVIFNDYLNTTQKNDQVIDIFRILMSNDVNISQLRYIDKGGNEKIRFDRKAIGFDSILVHDSALQNKANRYYFKDIKNTQNGTIWYSKIDLNVEHGVIQRPIVPTLRIGTPIYTNGEFNGILVMNIFFKDIIQSFVDSPFFYIILYDKDGEFIHNIVETDENIYDYSWSRYLKKDYTLKDHDLYIRKILDLKTINDFILNRSIANIIPNEDFLNVRYEPKLLKLKELEQNANNYIVTVTLIVLFISIPLAFLISIIPNTLNDELFETKKRLEQERHVVDEFVYLSIADTNGVIQDVSNAYAKMTGYAKEELIGKRHSILKHPSTSSDLHHDLWNTILNGEIWSGELTNLKKDGSSYNVKIFIRPNINEYGEIKNFSAYMQDITNLKKIERMSVTDDLTKLYNRREFSKLFKRYIGHAIRYKHPFAFMIFDIDFFKQYNDTYGHLEGDRALEKVAAEVMEHCKRITDSAFRLGGEEFGVLFSAQSEYEAHHFAIEIRKAIENLKIEHEKNEVSNYMTVSIGFFYREDVSDMNEDTIYQMCDEALYKAKKEGRNKVVKAT